ncbi:MAG: hypothetical protein J0H57_11060, partial [Rhodospirillales bacterium]|nr:hypothetical protein [Rhodospirillales bacterium]
MTDSTTAPADPTDHVPQDDAGASASPNAAEQPHASAEAGEGPGGAATGTEPAADLLAGDAGDAKPAKRPRAARGTAATRKADDAAPFSALAFKIMTDPFVGSLTFARI